jgi:1-acyl-sn-glycerol-3-phosphate acyltransferase
LLGEAFKDELEDADEDEMNLLATIGNLARSLVRRLLRLYYPRIEVEGRERIPAGGAVLFVANHPNSMVDPALIGWTAQRPVHFFAKAPLFNVPVFGALMHALGMVPAYRGADDKSQVRKNLESLDAGAAHLRRGEAVGIFPEGKTHDREGVEQVRTGAARIAVQALSSGARFVMVPLGLNYERKERFRSAVWVRVGEPLDAATWLKSSGEDDKKAIRSLTEEIDRRLKHVVVHLNEERWQPFLHELEVLLPPAGGVADSPIAALRQRKRIADAMNHFLATDRPRAEAMAAAIEAHRNELAKEGLKMDSPVLRLTGLPLAARLIKETLRLLPGLLPALAGTVHHAVPFWVTRGIVRLIKHPGRATIAMNRLLLGLPIYGAWYVLVWWLLAGRAELWIAWLWTALMPLCGLQALHYAWRLEQAGRGWWHELKMTVRRDKLEGLRRAQAGLRNQLQSLREEFARQRAEPAHAGENTPATIP